MSDDDNDDDDNDEMDNDILAKGGKKGWINSDGRRMRGDRTFECVYCGFYKCRCE